MHRWLAHSAQFLLGIVIFGQFGLYVVIRQVVNTMEWLFACKCVIEICLVSAEVQSGRGRKGVLRQRLRNAKSYQEWKEAAMTMDEYLGFNEWKRVSGSSGVASVLCSSQTLGRRGPVLRLPSC
jgi:hypothetical protein